MRATSVTKTRYAMAKYIPHLFFLKRRKAIGAINTTSHNCPYLASGNCVAPFGSIKVAQTITSFKAAHKLKRIAEILYTQNLVFLDILHLLNQIFFIMSKDSKKIEREDLTLNLASIFLILVVVCFFIVIFPSAHNK